MTTPAEITAADALALLVEFGQAATLERPSSTVGSAAYLRTGSADTYAVTLYQWEYEAAEVDGQRIEAGDARFLVAASGLAVDPKPDDRLVVGGDTWRVVRVKTIRENADAVLYIAQGRK